MSVRVLAIMAVAGCSFTPGRLSTGDDAAVDDDVLIDVPADTTPCTLWTLAPKHFDPCTIVAPGFGLAITAALSPWKLDTTTGILSNISGPVTITTQTISQTGDVDAFLVSAESFDVNAGALLTITGSKPLIVASWSTMLVQGTIDATSHIAASAGAGSNPAACVTNGQGALGADDATGGGSGGGGGGAFRGGGGKGGPGDSGMQNAGGNGGSAVIFPLIVRGGCDGGASGMAGASAPGNGGVATRRAPGGAGGGAVQLTARESITMVNAVFTAGGAGGAGTLQGDANGGGGGGSGGYLGLNAPSVALTNATLAANGGGGGGSELFVNAGDPGQDGQPSATAANGGPASSCSAAGGVGSAGGTLAGAQAAQTDVSCGGGGGGGGAGFIGVFSPGFSQTNGIMSPAHQLNPF